jgi:hypothetical protein
MADAITTPIREFLEWVAARARSYEETMEAWRTSCPRFSTWEDSEIDGLVRVEKDTITGQPMVFLTDKGRSILSGAA